MKHHGCVLGHILEGEEKPLECKELDPYRQKLSLLHGQIMDISKLVMTARSDWERPHSTDGVVAYELW